MSSIRRVLVVGGSLDSHSALRDPLAAAGIEAEFASGAGEAAQYLDGGGSAEVILLGIRLPDRDGLDFLNLLEERGLGAEVITFCACKDIDRAAESIRRGAFGYLLEPVCPRALLGCLERIRERRLAGERSPVPGAGGDFFGLIGGHPEMRELFRRIDGAGKLPAGTAVLIEGESGTGKELVARAVHLAGPGAGEPFIGVNCGAFSRTLLEDQLFGHVKGAFTGAGGPREGVFAAAGRGTLFLDEITEMDADLQVRLLRAIQEREVFPLGSDRPLAWHARLIAATNRDIQKEVESGRFRRDLFYRIHVIRLRVPPLRERLEDIPLLVAHFLDRFGRDAGRRKRCSREALDLLCRYSYPGNVRELRNAIERAHALGKADAILPEDLPETLRAPPQEGFKPLAAVVREHILRALRIAGGKKVQAARILKIDRNRLYRMIRRHGIGDEDLQGDPGETLN